MRFAKNTHAGSRRRDRLTHQGGIVKVSIRLGIALLLSVSNCVMAANPTAELLTEVIRVDTSNPPGNEALLAELLKPRFEALGFEVHIVRTPAADKAHFIARLRGDGSKKPLLLAAHADVVGV